MYALHTSQSLLYIPIRLLEVLMTTLTICNVDAAIKERLRVRAAPNGRSMEAELRQILVETFGFPKKVVSLT
jgi:hypothetical protein